MIIVSYLTENFIKKTLTEEGFKLKTREKLEQDLGDAVLEELNRPDILRT